MEFGTQLPVPAYTFNI